LQGIVKQFFNEKEVTSTLVMDALFCGCRQLEGYARKQVGAGSRAGLTRVAGGCTAVCCLP
jgi:hypothetical protein